MRRFLVLFTVLSVTPLYLTSYNSNPFAPFGPESDKDPFVEDYKNPFAVRSEDKKVGVIAVVTQTTYSPLCDGLSAFHIAAREGESDVVAYYVEIHGVNVNTSDLAGMTALHHAAAGGHEKVVHYLAEQDGIKIDATDTNGFTPISYAIHNGHNAIANYLAHKCGANTTISDQS